MNPQPSFRLALDCVAAGLLVLALAYYLWGNLPHEVIGFALFAFVTAHNIFNRRWYPRARHETRHPRGILNIAITVILVITMLCLLVTSVLISETAFAWASLAEPATAKRVHAAAGYWALVVVSIHLGLRWAVIMSTARRALRITRPSRLRTALLRVLAIALAALGIWSWLELTVATRLASVPTLDWWDFEASVAGFFVHCLAASAVCIAMTYYVSIAVTAQVKNAPRARGEEACSSR